MACGAVAAAPAGEHAASRPVALAAAAKLRNRRRDSALPMTFAASALARMRMWGVDSVIGFSWFVLGCAEVAVR